MNYSLLNDSIDTIGILVRDSAGNIVPAIAGDTFSVESSDPSKLNAVIGATASGQPAVVMNALVQEASGLSITVSDADGLTAFTESVDIGADHKPAALGLDLDNVTHADQPVPGAAS